MQFFFDNPLPVSRIVSGNFQVGPEKALSNYWEGIWPPAPCFVSPCCSDPVAEASYSLEGVDVSTFRDARRNLSRHYSHSWDDSHSKFVTSSYFPSSLRKICKLLHKITDVVENGLKQPYQGITAERLTLGPEIPGLNLARTNWLFPLGKEINRHC